MARKPREMNPRQVDTLPDGFWSAKDRLYLRVADGGRRRSWVFRFVRGGKVTSMGLGKAGQDGVSLAAARDKAKELNKALEEGVNPLMARRERQRSEAARKTLRQATEAYIEEKDRKWGASSRGIWRRFVVRDIEEIADAPVDTLGREQIKQAVNSLYRKTGEGNRKRRPGAPAARLLQQRIQTVLEYASECGWRPENSRFRWSMVAEYAKHEAERHHPALLPPEEQNERDGALIVEAIKRLRASTSVSALCLEFLALTAVRLSEATQAQWGEINLKNATWSITAPRMKMGKAHVVPLSERAMEIVAEAAGHKVNDYVFIGQRDGAPISRNTIRNQCDRVTGGKASPHGWRTTFRSWAASQGVSFEVAEICLAHAGEKLQKAYQRGDILAERRKVMERWSAFLSGEDHETGNVVAFASGARRA
jgi:integrase